MAETWVRPPLLGREARPAWIARWRFRLVMAVMLVLLVLLFVSLYRQISGANAQDPGIDGSSPSPAPAVTVPALQPTAAAAP